jgi:hypothetical protein
MIGMTRDEENIMLGWQRMNMHIASQIMRAHSKINHFFATSGSTSGNEHCLDVTQFATTQQIGLRASDRHGEVQGKELSIENR